MATTASGELPTLDDIRAAAARIAAHAHRTPVLTSSNLDALTGASLHFKCEMFQRVGAFKFRGACNAVMSLSDARAARGVVTHSSGNHGAALALAARLRGVPAYVVMPADSSLVKRQAVEAYGGRITLCEPTLAARDAAAARLLNETGGVMVHPFDDPAVIAGQGTLALELHEQAPGLDALVVPVSGGGLISGVAIASAAVSPRTEVIAAEPEQADDAARSFRARQLLSPRPTDHTIADGLRAGLSDRTFAVIRHHVRDVVTVSEAEIVRAMRLIWERLKVVAEPSAAVSLAAIFKAPQRFAGKRVGVILSGGNVDLAHLPWTAPVESAAP
jgi:threonine dehydratase